MSDFIVGSLPLDGTPVTGGQQQTEPGAFAAQSLIVNFDDFTLDQANPTDTFSFILDSTSDINLSLTDISTGDDTDLTLYRDSDGNGRLDTSVDQLIASSVRGSNLDDSINVADQATGTYFAQANIFSAPDGSLSYDLALSTASPSNLLPIETQVGDLSGVQSFFDQVGNTDTADVYAFSLGFREGTNITLDGLASDADIRLIFDSNGNRIVDQGDELTRSAAGGTSPDSISLDDAGNYFLQVYQFSGDTSYNLSFNTFDTPNTLALPS